MTETMVIQLARRSFLRLIGGICLYAGIALPFVLDAKDAESVTQMAFFLAWPILPLIGYFVYLMLLVARARTAAGPDGIHIRGAVRKMRIPWGEVAAIQYRDASGFGQTVRVIRVNGRATVLPAPRQDWLIRSPGFKQAASALYAMHGRYMAPAGPPSAPPVRLPVTLRYSRRPIPVVLAAIAAAAGAGTGVLLLDDDLLPYAVVSLAAVAWGARYVLLMFRGRTIIEPDGLRNRHVLAERFIPWHAIDGLVVRTALTGCHLGISRTVSGRGTTLASIPSHPAVPGNEAGAEDVAELIRSAIGPNRPVFIERHTLARTIAVITTVAAALIVLATYGTHPWGNS